jgi:hypothetical protein
VEVQRQRRGAGHRDRLRARPRRPQQFVRDNGVGFDMPVAGKLFSVFQRLHSAQKYEGTGIGLTTVERIVERHGGGVSGKGELGRRASLVLAALACGAAPAAAPRLRRTSAARLRGAFLPVRRAACRRCPAPRGTAGGRNTFL